jgi:hypothetical protein
MSDVGKRRGMGFWGALALLPLVAAPAAAQPFEYVYGGPGSQETGGRRATPVRACPGGGFAAVGTTTAPASPQNVYVVRVAADGTRLWEHVYDVAPGGDDRGQSLAEARDGSGFIIVGTSNVNPATGDDVLLMKIKCDGGPVWAVTYHSPRPETGYDVVEAQTGDPLFGTRPGDLLVAGATINAAGNTDALLMRTRSTGGLLWNRRYDLGGATELFRGLTEARPSGATSTGDVVGAGVFVPATGRAQGYAVRVSGNNGLIVAAPHNAAVFGGGANHEWFESVAELRVAPLGGSLVFSGVARSAAGDGDVYLARTSSDPSVVLAQRTIGDPVAGPLGEEAALDVREVLNAVPLAPPGTLALTGRAGSPAGPGFDAFLLLADAASLKTLPARSRLYGDHANGRETGVSVADHPGGFLIAGFSESNFEGLVPADPRDLYLVETDGLGHTSCDLVWDPPHVESPFPVERITPVATAFLQAVARVVRVDRMDTPYQNCP